MKILFFLICAFQMFSLHGQQKISNLSFTGCFVGMENKMQVSELKVSFEIGNSDEIQFIYLSYADRNTTGKKASFKLFELAKTQDPNLTIEKISAGVNRVTMEVPVLEEHLEIVNFVRLYISDTNRAYSNTLIFGE